MKFDVTKLPYLEVEAQLSAFSSDIEGFTRMNGKIFVEMLPVPV